MYTNGFEIAKLAENNENIKRVVVIGGKLRPQSGAMCGPIAVKTLDNLRFSQAFITITNINDKLDMFNNNEDEAFFTSKVIENSNQTICMIDVTKLQVDSHGNIITNAANIDYFVLDQQPLDEWTEKLKINSEIKW
ncbi:hypothetical protein [Spiroplasma clarkii]|uniref:hypothetical protein n=1 Tax=Spiroplasma clarkii TaxID=2139 RepID=UPI00214FFA91|nr:hypothetical protein [Spiroplasma clarkii]